MLLKERNILIVDDSHEILEIVRKALKQEGFIHIFTADSCKQAYEVLYEQEIHLLILDIMLPDGSGYDILKSLRKQQNTPALFLSALSDMEKQYQGFRLGADDYITKPFQTKDLIFRVLAILNRAYPDYSQKAVLDGAKIDFNQGIVYKQNQEFTLTAKEFSILRLLYENKNKIISQDMILHRLWGENSYGYNNTLMAHIRKIREKIEENPSAPKNLVTIKGLGYKLVMPHEG